MHFGKPWGQFYIDDLAVDAIQGDLSKVFGLYPTRIPTAQGKWPGASPARKDTPTAVAKPAVAGGGGVDGGCSWPFLAGFVLAMVLSKK